MKFFQTAFLSAQVFAEVVKTQARSRAAHLAHYLLALVLIVLGIARLHLSFENTRFVAENHNTSVTQLPVSQPFEGIAEVTTQVTFPRLGGHTVRIIPDDRLVSLALNGHSVSLEGVPSAALEDWKNGFAIDLRAYARRGVNTLSLRLENHSGPGGVGIFHELDGSLFAQTLAALTLGFGILFCALARAFKLSRDKMIVGLLSLCVICLYWLKTPFHLRQFDIFEGGGHLDYVRYLLEHHRMPPPGDGWEYHQPPLYYFSAVPTLALSQHFPSLGWEDLLRALSLGYWIIFLCSGLAIIQLQLGARRNAALLASIALCFWPSGIIHSIRAGNDVPLYAWHALSLYATCKWWYSQRLKHFAWACGAMALAAMTKSNGLAMTAVLISLLALKFVEARLRRLSTKYSSLRIPALLLGASLVLVLSVNFSTKLVMYWRGQSQDWLLSNVGVSINPALRVGNALNNYLTFDLDTFVSQPWMNAWDDVAGRQHFWNYLLRSSISSEFAFASPALKTLGTAAGLLLLLLVAHVLRTCVMSLFKALRARRLMAWRRIYRALPIACSGVSLLLLLLAYRIKAPMGCNTDFRYIYPALISLILAESGQQRFHTTNPQALRFAAPLIGLCGAAWVFWI